MAEGHPLLKELCARLKDKTGGDESCVYMELHAVQRLCHKSGGDEPGSSSDSDEESSSAGALDDDDRDDVVVRRYFEETTIFGEGMKSRCASADAQPRRLLARRSAVSGPVDAVLWLQAGIQAPQD